MNRAMWWTLPAVGSMVVACIAVAAAMRSDDRDDRVLKKSVRDLERSVSRLQEDVRSLRDRLAADGRGRKAEWRGRRAEDGEAKAEEFREPEPKPTKNSSLDALLLALVKSGYGNADMDALLKWTRKNKKQDDLIRAIKELLGKDPNNAKTHFLLAQAYVEKLMTEPWHEREKLGNLAMGEYDYMVTSYAGSYTLLQENAIKATGPKLFVEFLAVAVDKSTSLDSTSLRAELAKHVQAMKDDGTLTRFSMQIYGEDLTTK